MALAASALARDRAESREKPTEGWAVGVQAARGLAIIAPPGAARGRAAQLGGGVQATIGARVRFCPPLP